MYTNDQPSKSQDPTSSGQLVSKVAHVTLAFWVMKFIATTLGETAGDFISQTLNLGYIVGIAVTGALLLLALVAQISAKTYKPALFWTAIVATTTAGTETSDLMDRTLGLGYAMGSLVLTGGLLASLAVWYLRDGTLRIDPITRRGTEIMFWVAVLFSNSLGTAFGDYLVDNAGLGYLMSALVCSGVILAVMGLHYKKIMNEVALFWLAFIFTRPFGATFGDFLTKPVAKGGLYLGTYNASLVCLVLMSGILYFGHRRSKLQQAIQAA